MDTLSCSLELSFREGQPGHKQGHHPMDKMVSESQETRRGHGEGGGMVALEHVVAGGPSGADVPAERGQREEAGVWEMPPFLFPCSPSSPHGSDFHTSLPEGGRVGTRGARPTSPCRISVFKGQPSRRASTQVSVNQAFSGSLGFLFLTWSVHHGLPSSPPSYGNTSQPVSLASLIRVQLLAQTLGPSCLQSQQPWAGRSNGQVDCRREGKPKATC